MFFFISSSRSVSRFFSRRIAPRSSSEPRRSIAEPAGITPPDITGPGPLGLVSKSGTLTYQLMHELRDLGFTTCIGIGGDPVVGTTHIEALEAFEADPDTRLVVMIGKKIGRAHV